MDARGGAPTIELLSSHWERIQLHLCVRPLDGTGLDEHEVFLRQVDGPRRTGTAALAARMRAVFSGSRDATGAPSGSPRVPLRIARDGDAFRLRINVMQGPALMPLDPVRWRLELRDGPLRLVPAPGIDVALPAMSFALQRGVYHVVPTVAGDGGLELHVSLDTRTRTERDLPLSARARALVLKPIRAGRIAAFRVAFTLLKRPGRRSRRLIVFTTEARGGIGGSLKDVHDRMLERGLDRQYWIHTLVKHGVGARRGLRERLRLVSLLAGADVIVIDDFQPIIYRVPTEADVRIIQLWHASGAFKTVGYSRVGKPGGPDPFSRVHKNYSHAIVSSDHDVPFYAEAFGIPDERVVPTGIPRMDRFFDERTRAAGLAAARAAFPETEGRTTILFAPTFRGDGPRTASYDLARIDYAALHSLAVERDAVVIVKMHPFVTEPLGIPERYRDRILDGSDAAIDVNDLLFAVDLLITDYSSIVFEFSTLGRPMLFYAYDLEEYIATRDFYEPFETFVPGRIVRTFDELIDAIRREDYELEKVAAFAERHFAHLDAGSTDRVIDQLILAP